MQYTRRVMTITKLAENHFMIPSELIAYANKHRDKFNISNNEQGEPIIEVYTGGLLLLAAKGEGLARHPERYGMKLSNCGSFYVRVGN